MSMQKHHNPTYQCIRESIPDPFVRPAYIQAIEVVCVSDNIIVQEVINGGQEAYCVEY